MNRFILSTSSLSFAETNSIGMSSNSDNSRSHGKSLATSRLLHSTIRVCCCLSTFDTIRRMAEMAFSKPFVMSTMPSMTSASSIFLNVRSIPIRSISSVVCRMPAVSMKRYKVPKMLNVSSTVSRVVPSISLTIARSSPKMAFRSVLLPVFVSPAIVTGIPFFMALPRRNDSVSLPICEIASSISSSSCVLSANSTSSSEKSNSSSKREVMSNNLERMSRNSFENPPFN